MGAAVSKQQAINEINEWLDFKRVRGKKRESNQESIDDLVEAIEDGYLSFDSDSKELVMELSIPLGSDEQIKEFRFKPRLSVGEVHPFLKKVKQGDSDGRLLAYVRALTNQTQAVIDSMDTNDQNLAVTITIFFL